MDTKVEILQKLYAIRAGLSTISLKKDQVVALDQRIARASDDIQCAKSKFSDGCNARSRDIENKRNRISSLEASIEKKKEDMAHAEELRRNGTFDTYIASTFKEEYKKPYPSPKASASLELEFSLKPAVYGFFLIIGIISLIGGIIYLFASPLGLVEAIKHIMETPAFMCILFGGTLALVFGILSIINRARTNKKMKPSIQCKEKANKEYDDSYRLSKERHLRRQREYYANLPREIQEHKNEIVKLTSGIENANVNLEEYKAAFPAQEKSLTLKKDSILFERKVTVDYANSIYKALSKDYGSFLSVGDWQNLDYIIYLFETNRADTVKEALILLDEVKRHEMLIKAMGHISNTISEGFGEMKSAMMSGFSALSTKLFTMSMQMDSITSLQESHGDIFRSLTGKVDVFADLTKKIKTSSEEMAKDLEYIRRQY